MKHFTTLLLVISSLTGIKGQCETERGEFSDCTNSTLTVGDAASCINCVGNMPIPDLDSCSDIGSVVCTSLLGCGSCGACVDEFESYMNCRVESFSGGDCSLDCANVTYTSSAQTMKWHLVVSMTVASLLCLFSA